MAASEKIKAKKGLEGVIFDTTQVSHVLPEQKSLYYRGYPVHELADECSFEEVAYLLLYGELPTAAELEKFCALERQSRALSPQLMEVIQRFPVDGHPMDALRTGVSYLGMEPEFAGADNSESAIRKGIALLAKIPTMIAAFSADVAVRRWSLRVKISPSRPISFTCAWERCQKRRS